jgi:hypothetical protein
MPRRTNPGKPKRDGTPEPFTFAAVTGAAPEAFYTTDETPIVGTNITVSGSVSDLAYSLNGGLFTAVTPFSVPPGSSIRVRKKSAAAAETAASGTLTVGGVSATFTVTTGPASPVIPVEPFSFPAVTSALLDTEYTSEIVEIVGPTAPVGGSIVGGEYSKNDAPFTGSAFTAVGGDLFAVRRRSSALYSTAVAAVLTVGNESGAFTITTGAIPPAPGLTPLTQRRGALTKAGAGSVPLADLMAPGESIASWVIQHASGTAGHWTTPSDGTSPAPTAAGVTAGLNGGPYVFTVTAVGTDGNSAQANLTINVVADVYTISKRTEILGVTAGGDSRSSLIAGKAVEFARGSTDFATNVAGALTFKFWRATSAAHCIIRHEDPDNPCDLNRFVLRRCAYLDFVSVVSNAATRIASYSSEYSWYLGGGGTTDAPDQKNIRFLDTYGSCGVSAPDTTAPPTWITGVYFGSDCSDIEFYNWEQYGTSNGFFFYPSVVVTATFHGRTVNRYFSANVWRTDQLIGASSLHFDNLLMMSPFTDSSQPGVHADGFQAQNGSDVQNVTCDLYQFFVADGNLTAAQSFFSRAPAAAPTDYSLLGMTLGAVEILLRARGCMTVSGWDATHVFSARFITIMQQRSGVYGQDYYVGGALVAANSPQYALSPKPILNSALTSSNLTFANAFIPDGFTQTPSGFSTATIVNASGAVDYTPWYPNSGWISSAAIQTLLTANATVQNYDGVDDERWHGTVDEVLADVINAFTPTEGGLMMNPDGTYNGSRFPDGSINDGSVY